MKPGRDFDVIIVGGGLAGGLCALALAKRRPELAVALVEAGEALGGNHVWSWFASDADGAMAALLEPLVAARWPAYSVHFFPYGRRLNNGYASATGEALDAAVRAVVPSERLFTGIAASVVEADAVTLADGRRLCAGAVLDARGASHIPGGAGGWQKFRGRMLVTASPHGMTEPVVMDARLNQRDGYRFVYTLPFDTTHIFVEDTYYSSSPALDVARLDAMIDEYARMHGWQVASCERAETGVLPVVAKGSFAALWPIEDRVARAGVRAGLFHPLTGYSLPIAAGFALWLSEQRLDDGERLAGKSRAYAARHWRAGGFYRMLAAMLFGAGPSSRRFKVFERFYTLRPALIARFYAGRSTMLDRARILAGRPPVPVAGALAVLLGRRKLADLSKP